MAHMSWMIDLPGFKTDEISATLENGYLTISAHRRDWIRMRKTKEGKYIRQERYAGAMSRSFYVGEDVKAGGCKGEIREWYFETEHSEDTGKES